MTKRIPKLKRTAYHEAGHAVAYCALGRRFDYVDIVPDEHSEGRCVARRFFGERFEKAVAFGDSRAMKELENRLMISLAGTVAEKLLTGRHNWIAAGISPTFKVTDRETGEVTGRRYLAAAGDYGLAYNFALEIVQRRHDFHRIMDVSPESFDKEVGRYLDWHLAHTANLLRSRLWWPGVEALAAELVEHGQVGYRRAREIVSEAYTTALGIEGPEKEQLPKLR